MRLSRFIEENHDKILAEWVAFASTLLPWAKGANETDLLDHAKQLLTAVVADMHAPQTDDEQSDKARGLSPGGALARIGHAHASDRLATGFNLEQLVAEYRALRASILRLWAENEGHYASEVTRFNEAIDESLAEATIRYSQIVDGTRDQFLDILGHDLRNPLHAIVMGATLLTGNEALPDKDARVAMRILNSATRMNRMVSDLLDLTRTRLGTGIPVMRRATDLKLACDQVVAELAAVHPDNDLRCTTSGDLTGTWDFDRLVQVISNLVANALEHGGEHGAVNLSAEGEDESVVVRVHNTGAPISEKAMDKLFQPMVRNSTSGADRNPTGLGLGLHIAREIVAAHGGTLTVTSSADDGTTFTVTLPREQATPRRASSRPPPR